MTKKHEPTDKTRAEVEAMASFGVIQDDISAYIGIDLKTLRKYYREQLDNAATRANMAVARVLYEKCVVDKDTASVIFWMKTRAGFREVNRHEVSGVDGKAIETKTKYEEIDLLMKERFKLVLNKEDKDERGNVPK